MTEEIKAFGPSALVTPANAVTVARLVAAPIFAVVVAEVHRTSWLLFVLWCVLAASDGADGKLARWHGTTRSGAFLDPLADKFLVLGALAALAGSGRLNWVGVLLIGIRELWMSLYRIRAGRRGISVPARPSAKLKTGVQDLVIGLALFPPVETAHHGIVSIVLWCAVVLTLFTGAEYLVDTRRHHSKPADGAEPANHRTVGI